MSTVYEQEIFYNELGGAEMLVKADIAPPILNHYSPKKMLKHT